MGAHDLNLKKVPLFVRKPVNINGLRSGTPYIAIYSIHMLMSVHSCIRIERGSEGGGGA